MNILLNRMQVWELSPELISLAFLILVQNNQPEPPGFPIPEPLQHLTPEDWGHLEFLLISLRIEQQNSLVH